MADVFISYATEDRARAGQLATALATQGWTVWWDRKIVAGQMFDQVIERELEAAGSVVVLWSAHAVASEWVKNEAAAAAERNVLVPALLDSVRLPLEFRRRQTVDLADWTGAPSHPGFVALCEGIASTLGTPAVQPAPVSLPASPTRRAGWGWIAGIGAAVALGLGGYALRPGTAPAPAPAPPAAQPGRPQVPAAATALADLAAGTYLGAVVADSQGSSRSDITVTVARVSGQTVRVTSDYARIGTTELTLTRAGNQILNAGTGGAFIVDLGQDPPTLAFNPRHELAYSGTRQR